MLDHTLRYDHVLYCIDNETSGEEEWGRHWARVVKERAAKAGRTVYVTEMWDDWNLAAARHKRTFDHPELYGLSMSRRTTTSAARSTGTTSSTSAAIWRTGRGR